MTDTTENAVTERAPDDQQKDEQIAVAAHPHHNLVHGVVIAAESLIRQLEANVHEECSEAIEHLHSAVSRLKHKLEFVYKKPE